MLRSLKTLLISCAVLFAGLCHAQGPVVVRKGPELEVQKNYTPKLFAMMDGELLDQRWTLFLDVYSSFRPKSDPLARVQRLIALLKWRNEQHGGDPSEIELASFWEEKRAWVFRSIRTSFSEYVAKDLLTGDLSADETLAKLRTYSRYLHTNAPLAIALANTARLAWPTELQWLTEAEKPILAPYQDFVDNGLYTLKGDESRSFKVTGDNTVFEIVHFPPFEDQSLKTWIPAMRERLGIPADALPAQTLNPHFHYSRTFDAPVPEHELKALAQELRVLTALVTINEAETEGVSKPSRPFYGGLNAANTYWYGSEEFPDPSMRGNVRLILPDRSTPFKELRVEFRSLGNLKWEKIHAFMDAIETALQAETLAAIRINIRKMIADKFIQSDRLKMEASIRNSIEGQVTWSELRPIRDYLERFRLEVFHALSENHGKEAAKNFLTEKFPIEEEASCRVIFRNQWSNLMDYFRRLIGPSRAAVR